MFPSNSNGNNDPIPCIDHSIFHRHFPTDNTPYSKQEDIDIPLSFFHSPSPYYNQCDFQLQDHDFFFHKDLVLHQHALMTDNSVSEITNKNEESTIDCTIKTHPATDHKQIPRKRSSSKRDRHSKINTANGPRDRRMRLSLDVARQFFGLQDMLGYDKASRTVEWLLIQAKPEIKKLARSQLSHVNHSCSVLAARSPSSTSEGEVVSGIDKAAIEGSKSKKKPSTKEKNIRRPRKTTFPLPRDLREKARARAKARTKEKIMWTQRFDESKLCDNTRNHDLNEFSSWRSFETCVESGIQDHNRNNPSSQAVVAEVSSGDHQHVRIHGYMVDESLEIMNKWSPNSSFNCLQNAGTNQEYQLTGFQSFGKPWDGYNNRNL
ncbi:hypothetical protein PTKIN_Ptkin05aG0142100 [Pterospermum kingtungense]